MPERDTIISSSVKKTGIVDFAKFYKFCYDWLMEDLGLNMFSEEKYKEKLIGDKKEIDIVWSGYKKFTDYFRMNIKVEFEIKELRQIEIMKNNQKIQTNQGQIKIKVKGELVRDYQGKFEGTPFNKFLRGIYEKWVIPSRIEDFEDKTYEECDTFLSQIKAYLDLEGKF